MIMSAVAYGVVVTLYVLSLQQLVRTTTKYNYTQRVPFIIYITMMVFLGTLFLAAIGRVTELSFIDNRLFPGGPAAFENYEFSIPVGDTANVAYVVANWLADGMVIYRYMVIYRSSPQFSLWVVMVIPVLAYFTSISLGVVWLIQISSPADSPWKSNNAINFTAPYFWMSLSLNIAMTIAICARLLIYRRRVSKVLGPRHGTEYTSVAAMIVESSLLYSVFALLFLIPFALNNAIQNVFLQLLGEVQIIAPLLITYRVAYGGAWGNGTSRDLLSTRETKETQKSGVRVQVEFSGPGPHDRTMHTKSDITAADVYEAHEMEKFREV
jgi:hypothetical protein